VIKLWRRSVPPHGRTEAARAVWRTSRCLPLRTGRRETRRPSASAQAPLASTRQRQHSALSGGHSARMWRAETAACESFCSTTRYRTSLAHGCCEKGPDAGRPTAVCRSGLVIPTRGKQWSRSNLGDWIGEECYALFSVVLGVGRTTSMWRPGLLIWTLTDAGCLHHACRNA